MQNISKGSVARVGLVLLVALLLSIPIKLFAAGSAVISAESASSVTTGSNITVNFYATPSSANIYSGEFNATLTNLTFQSYSSSGSPFNGLNIVVAGNSAGSTNFTVAFSHIGSSAGSSAKALIGTATLRASGSAGTGQVQLGGLIADDNTGDSMSVSASGKTISITAPPAASTCPAGQTGTPPNCTTPSSGGGGGTNTPATSNSSNTSNPIDNPNPDSQVNIPTSDDAEPETISEDEASKVVTGAGEFTTTSADTEQESSMGWLKYAAGAIVLLVLVGAGAKAFFAWQTRTAVGSHAAFKPPAQMAQTSPPPHPQTPAGHEPQVIKPTAKEDGRASSSEDIHTPQP